MGSAPTVFQGVPLVESVTPEGQAEGTSSVARKLTFSTVSRAEKLMAADIVKGNRSQQLGIKLDYFPLVLKDGVKTVQLVMLRLKKSVFLHNEGYFIFRFIYEEEKVTLFQNGPYTFNNRPLVLKQWEPNFQMSKEPLQVIPVWVRFPKLPIQYWTLRSLGRIASCLGKPVCTYKLIAKGDRVSYAHILIEMDVSMELQEEIPIELRGGKCKLHTIEYEWKPLYCQTCLNIEHHNGDCKKTMQTDKVKQQMNRKKQKMDWRVKTGARTQGTTKPTEIG
nr:uncharacterized protein LOC104101141 [Nicotiana tomentosiformis]